MYKTCKQLRSIGMNKWFSGKASENLRAAYPLNEDSIVFDLGGYKGDWTQKIYDKYKCNVYIFEPVPEFFRGICQRFKGNPKIHPFNIGLADKDSVKPLSIAADGSSIFKHSDNMIDITLKNIRGFLKEWHINYVDLIKINIEGAEYDLLEYMIDTQLIKIFKNIQVQFHCIENAKYRRSEIQYKLKNTHHLTYNYDFVWENWLEGCEMDIVIGSPGKSGSHVMENGLHQILNTNEYIIRHTINPPDARKLIYIVNNPEVIIRKIFRAPEEWKRKHLRNMELPYIDIDEEEAIKRTKSGEDILKLNERYRNWKQAGALIIKYGSLWDGNTWDLICKHIGVNKKPQLSKRIEQPVILDNDPNIKKLFWQYGK